MLHAPSGVLNKQNGRVALPSTTVQQDASKTIVHAICSGRSVVGIVATASTATSAVIVAALEDLVSRQTRVIRMGQTKVSCLGPALAMDHLRINEMQINGGSGDRSKQIVQGLQLLGQPVPGEKRRILVIEEAEGVDPALLENLARMPGLAAPTLPLQLLYVGTPAYWDRLVAISDGAARRLIGSPMILLQPPGETETVAASPAAMAEVRPNIRMQRTPEKIRRSRWMLTGFAFLAGGVLVVLGFANQSRVAAFVEAYHPQAQDDAKPVTKTAVMVSPASVIQKADPDHMPLGDSKAPVTGGENLIVKSGAAETTVNSESLHTIKTIVNQPASADINHTQPSQTATVQPILPVTALDPANATKTISTSISRGDAMFALHDLSAARRYYELAAKAGSADAALALARTYDPTILARSVTVNVRADTELATVWYRKAATLGSDGAKIALQNLTR